MPESFAHIPEQELLLATEKELPAARQAEVEQHLAQCEGCRRRQAEFECTIAEYSEAYRASGDAAARAAAVRVRPARRTPALWWSAGALAAALAIAVALNPVRTRGSLPDPELTPGAVVAASLAAICAAGETSPDVPAAVARDVFRRYGIHEPKPRAFEVDFLITPALGGSGDVRNLWPQPYTGGEWNSRVKDALEDHLRAMVCSGRLSLAEAQQDIARDWIAAYRKHFRTGRPLVGHFSFVKDRPWE